jgi:hypothetical protein
MSTENKQRKSKFHLLLLNGLVFVILPLLAPLLFFYIVNYIKKTNDEEISQDIKEKIEVYAESDQYLKLRTVRRTYEAYRNLEKMDYFAKVIPVVGGSGWVYLRGKLVGKMDLKGITVVVDITDVTIYLPPPEVEFQLERVIVLNFKSGLISTFQTKERGEFLDALKKSDPLQRSEDIAEIGKAKQLVIEKTKEFLASLLRSLYPELNFHFVPPSQVQPKVDRYT